MNALTYSGLDGFLARFAALRPQLSGDVAARDAAAAILRAQGLPSIRDEAWKYTNLRPVAQADFHTSVAAANPSAVLARLPQQDAPRLVLVDGHYRADLSIVPAHAKISTFAAAPQFSALANPAREPMVALNTMLAEDGLSLTIPANIDAGLIVIAHVATAAHAFHPRHTIILESGARASLLEIYLGDGAYLHNPVTEIDIADNAHLAHARLQDESVAAFHLATIYARIAARGIYDSFSLNIGARLSRTELHVNIAGTHATAQLNAAQLLAGVQHADFTTIVSHDAPHGASRQTVKNVLAGRSRGVFQGKIYVGRGAQKTDGYQMNQALLLSPEAEIDSKPQLEIYADDVKCSHGATVGELDADQFFYLRSRGVPEIQARAMLVRAFLAGSIDMVTNEAFRAVLENAVESWWQRNPV
ncbi:MAG: Fe-S cluster assembly protein SufD [Acetobacteraceae bacterium]|nr:Fe-S cluster assembly protein SufD [Acetobacteraceae bacterium]